MPRAMTDALRQTVTRMGLTLLVGALVGGAFYGKARADLIREAEEDLLLLMALRTSALQSFLESTRSEVVFWSDHGPLREGLIAFSAAWEQQADPATTLQRLYIDDNPFPEGRRSELDDAGDGSAYSSLHATIQPRVRRFLEIHEYYDIFLCDADGNVLYTYYKEPDYATNLLTGEFSDAHLSSAFREARSGAYRSHVTLTDFRRYAPSAGQPAAFMASPVDAGDELLGVLAIQLSVDRINEIMQFTEGMGDTGETYVVGVDMLMRSASRFSDESTVLEAEVDTEPARRALAGESGVVVGRDYRGENSVSAFGPLEFEGVRWAVIAEKDVAEILQSLSALRRLLIITVLVVVALVGAAGSLLEG